MHVESSYLLNKMIKYVENLTLYKIYEWNIDNKFIVKQIFSL